MTIKRPKYGSEEFSNYSRAIVEHPAYAGMPDPVGERGEIQWEAPSNRSSGQFKETHNRRRDWWRQKAISIGITPDVEANWISKTAKRIHPFGSKPCKSCGKVMEIAYCYPNEHLFTRIRKLTYWDKTFELSEIEHICDLIARMDDRYGQIIFNDLASLLNTSSITVPAIPHELAAWQDYLVHTYIPMESRMLSPGAMSNPPDRFDGFHSFNRCCRPTADKGRSKENLGSYGTDRRAFEYWVDGDWVAANRLMGHVRTDSIFLQQQCFNLAQGGTHTPPVQADHIGPISLGFSHRPEFQLLCKACNSGKNNRMYASDVALLLRAEAAGKDVVSWYARAIWDLRKGSVNDNETALRLSKQMRDNRHTYMGLLRVLLERKHFVFLASLLHLQHAEYEPTFLGLRAENHVTKYDCMVRTLRSTKYVAEQKARQIRIAFIALQDYHQKANRNAVQITNDAIDLCIAEGVSQLFHMSDITRDLDNDIEQVLLDRELPDEYLRILAERIPQLLKEHSDAFASVKTSFQRAMDQVGRVLSNAWQSDRYVRSSSEDLIE